MTKRVLDVGNCAMDHDSIRSLVETHFDAQVVQAHSSEEAQRQLQAGEFALVLVNRKLDRDHSDGLAIIQQIKCDPATADTPVMMITNFADHQQAAVAHGAEPGFGKSELNQPSVKEKLTRFLSH